MNSIDFIQDKEQVMSSLERAIVVDGQPVTNIGFATHLFNCAKDLLPFEDSLLIYGYKEEDFPKPTLSALKACYYMGNSHVKRDLTHRMLHENDPAAQNRTDAILSRVFELYVAAEEGSGSTNVNIYTKQVEAEDEVGVQDKTVITENEVPDAAEL